MKRGVLLLSCLTAVLSHESDILQTFSESFGNTILECRDETTFSYDIITEFLLFWDHTYAFQNPGIGCVVLCVFSKLELLDNTGNLRMENARAFGKSIGSDDNTTSRLISLYGLCQSAIQKVGDECDIALELTKCFRYGIFQLHWAPDPPQTDYE